MTHRKILGLQEAERIDESPWPRTRATPAQALGNRYERKVAARLLGAEHNPWFRFRDQNGEGHCSPDFLWATRKWRIVMECKLSDWMEGWEQIEDLYLPVLQMVFTEPIIPIVMVKNASRGVMIVDKITQAIEYHKSRPVLHWIGSGPIQW